MRLLLAHWRAALVELIRLPGYLFPTLILPLMLFAFFGIPNASRVETANLLFASFATFAVFGVVFFQFGVGIAQYRESAWEDYLRTLPAGPLPRFGAQILTAMVFAGTSIGLIAIAAVAFADASFTLQAALRLPVAFLAGAIPFGFFGIALGYWVTPRAAIPMANLLYLPLSFVGGLWQPPDRLPRIVAEISQLTPTRHFAELTWAAALDQPWPPASWLWLIGYTGLFAMAALAGYRRDEGQRFS